MLKRIQITNMGPFPEFDSGELPAVVLIDGDNGIGKTGLLDCIKWVGEKGHDPDILHGNAESGEIVITNEDGAQLRARTTRTETTRSWKPKDGKRWIQGRDEIEKVYRAIAYDPLAFLNLKPEKQAELLASLSPVQATPEEIADAIGGATVEAEDVKLSASGMGGLDHINAIRKSIYDARTTLNVGADTQEKHALELERTLPPAAPDGENWSDTAARLQREKETIEEAERQSVGAIGDEFRAKEAAAKVARETELAAIDADIEARIKVLNIERQERKDAATTTRDTAIAAARAEANRKAGEVRAASQPDIERLGANLATAQERARAQQEAEGTRKAIAAAKAGAASKKERSAVLTASIERLDSLKVKLAERLPIPGARVEGGRIVREQDGGLVPLKRWNTADQYRFCLRFGMMLGGGFVCVDHMEAFTDANQQRIYQTAEAYAKEQGVQFIMAKVNPKGGELRIAPALQEA